MNNIYTEEQYADLFCIGQAPPDTMVIVKWVWEKIDKENQATILKTQSVMLLDKRSFQKDGCNKITGFNEEDE